MPGTAREAPGRRGSFSPHSRGYRDPDTGLRRSGSENIRFRIKRKGGRSRPLPPPSVASRGKAQFVVQTFMVFMLVSASVLVLKVPLSTIVVVVVVGLVSTMVHFLVVASRTM